MTNSTSNTGAFPLRYHNGGAYSGQHNLYVAETGAAALRIGDFVVRTGTANTARITTATERYNIGQLPTIDKATVGATNRITGVVIGFKPRIGALDALHGATGIQRVVMVADDPNVVFGIRDYGSIAIGVAAIGLNAVLKAGTDNADDSRSGIRLDDGTTTAPAADATYQLRIVRAGESVDGIENDPTLAGAIWEVMINLHTEHLGTGNLGL